MNKISILLILFVLISCKDEKNSMEIDDQAMNEYYSLCLGANEYIVSSDILKQPDFAGSDRYFAELIRKRFITAKITVLNKGLTVDTIYYIPSYLDSKMKFKPIKERNNTCNFIDKRFVARQEYLGANLLDKNPMPNVVLIQNASIIYNTDKVVVTELYFKTPVYNGNIIFGKIQIKDADMDLISFVNRLQRNDNIFMDKFKATVMQQLN